MQFERILGKMINVSLIQEVECNLKNTNQRVNTEGYEVKILYEVTFKINNISYTMPCESVRITHTNTDFLSIYYDVIDKLAQYKQERLRENSHYYGWDSVYESHVRQMSMHTISHTNGKLVIVKDEQRLFRYLTLLEENERKEILKLATDEYFCNFIKNDTEDQFIHKYILRQNYDVEHKTGSDIDEKNTTEIR